MTKNLPGSIGANPRVLIVENDPHTRIANQALITHWGYQAILAEGEGQTLICDAKAKARQYCCQLALIDLRLLDDLDEDDNSGLKLANEIKPTASILLSGHGNQKVLRDLLKNHKDIPFVGKGDPRQAIEQALETEARRICSAKRQLKIGPLDILTHISQTTFGSLVGDYPDQVTDVLARLFPNANELRIEPLDAKPKSSNISSVPRPKSVILMVYEDDLVSVIVKLARKKKIEIEVEKYHRFIDKRLKGNFVPRLENHAELWAIGGASYSYIGDFDVQTFTCYFEENDIKDIEESLRSFFCNIWGRHYSRAKDRQDVSLFELYNQVWERDWFDRVKKFQTPNFPHPLADMIDPIEWLKANVGEGATYDASLVKNTRVAVTHGDLHGDNLLVDSKKNPWVIDFERSGEGHALQDFIELESDLINRLTYSGENFDLFFLLCLTVTEQQEIDAIPLGESFPEDLEIRKILNTISTIRSLARECTTITDIRQYLLGLLFNTIFRATIVTGEHKKHQKRALMLAGMLCHRLDHWGQDWPPKEWESLLKTGRQ